MSLIKSISGIRGNIGGKVGNSLTPLDSEIFCCLWQMVERTVRNSNTEPIIGIYAEAETEADANTLVIKVMQAM